VVVKGSKEIILKPHACTYHRGTLAHRRSHKPPGLDIQEKKTPAGNILDDQEEGGDPDASAGAGRSGRINSSASARSKETVH